MWMRYRQVADGRIETQLRTDADWKPHTYRIEAGSICWIFEESEQVWNPLDLCAAPSWYEPMKMRQLRKNGYIDGPE